MALVVALLLVLTGIRLAGGLAVETHRGANAAATPGQPEGDLLLTKASRATH